MPFSDIPAELQSLPQWVVWRSEDIGARKSTKVPYNAKTGTPASVNDPNTWSDFNTAVTKSSKDNYSGIGFVFSDTDPYTFIDLDDPSHLSNGQINPNHKIDLDRQIKIYKEFDSYAEISPSGAGLHIIVRGNIPSGRRRSFIEIYSTSRYATFTGNIYNNRPIMDGQEKLNQLYEQMGTGGIATTLYQGDHNETTPDSKIIEQALNATNGDKFKRLLDGDWTGLYPSQSEADFAFVDIVAFYSRNKSQIIRLFQNSKLGERAKAKRIDYVNWMVNKSFDNMLPPIDFDGFKNAVEAKIAQKQLPLPEPPRNNMNIELPPGLLGELAQFIYQAAPRPVPEIAMAAAIGLMAGICGRAYNISNTGLNQYILLIAKTGTGKEAMASGIDKLMNEIRMHVPTSPSFIGPAEIASGQALVKYLNKNHCFVSILGEFGLRLQSMSSNTANTSEIGLRRMLLDLYNKSGFGQVFRPSIYSDKDKNIEATYSPSFTILGESTPERFYGALSEEMISEGLLPRFMLIEYTGNRPDLSSTFSTVVPSFHLTEKLSSLVANVETIMHSKRVMDVKMTEEAAREADKFDRYATAHINAASSDIIRQLWNRAHIKALKTAALIAVGVNMSYPEITLDNLEWALKMVKFDIDALSSKFETGEIGPTTGELKQVKEVIRVIKEFIVKDWDYVKKYCQGKNMQELHRAKIIPNGFINKKLSNMAAFKNEKPSPTAAINRTLQNMIESDMIRETGRQDLMFKYGTSQKAFVISNPAIFDDSNDDLEI